MLHSSRPKAVIKQNKDRLPQWAPWQANLSSKCSLGLPGFCYLMYSTQMPLTVKNVDVCKKMLRSDIQIMLLALLRLHSHQVLSYHFPSYVMDYSENTWTDSNKYSVSLTTAFHTVN